MPTPVQLKRNGTPGASAPSSLLHGELALNYGDARIFWRDASNVIQSFTFQSYALASHTHSISDVTGLQTALDGKAASSHTHSISDVTGLQTALDGKASSSHTHAASDITSGTLDIARIANDAVTYAKIQNVSATDRLLGRSSAGAGDVEEITCTSFGRSLISSADAATARTTLSVQPTASPAFTGAATFENTGNVVPVTITNAGTANSFVVNDASGDTTPFVIDASGNVGIGTSPAALSQLHQAGTYPTSSNATQVIRQSGTIPSGTTNEFIGVLSAPATQAASFTLPTLRHFHANPQAFGAGSTVTDQYGFVAESTLTGATNNYGFLSAIASGTNRWNFYASGTAKNYFGGQVLVTAGSVSAPAIAASSDTDTGMYFGLANECAIAAGGLTRVIFGTGDNRTLVRGNNEQYGLGVHYGGAGGSVYFGATSNSLNPDAAISNAGGGTLMTFANDGKITASGVYNNTVGGTNRDVFVDSGGLIGYVSSIRESKTDIVTLDDVSWLSALAPVSYRYRKKNADGTYSDEADGVTDYGLIAEDVEAVKPELCFYDMVDGEPQLRGVTYSKLITPMLRYIQQLEQRIAALEERING